MRSLFSILHLIPAIALFLIQSLAKTVALH